LRSYAAADELRLASPLLHSQPASLPACQPFPLDEVERGEPPLPPPPDHYALAWLSLAYCSSLAIPYLVTLSFGSATSTRPSRVPFRLRSRLCKIQIPHFPSNLLRIQFLIPLLSTITQSLNHSLTHSINPPSLLYLSIFSLLSRPSSLVRHTQEPSSRVPVSRSVSQSDTNIS